MQQCSSAACEALHCASVYTELDDCLCDDCPLSDGIQVGNSSSSADCTLCKVFINRLGWIEETATSRHCMKVDESFLS